MPSLSTAGPVALPASPIAERAVRVAGISGVGAALPPEVVTNAPIAERLGVDDEWIVARTGVHQRRRAGPEGSLTELATEAGRAALDSAGVEPEEIDLVMVASLTQDDLLPNAAPLVADRLGAPRAGALDLGAGCTGFISGISLASSQVEAGRAQSVLVIGADLLSRVTDHDDRRTAALFGDGAGATVVTAGGGGRIGPILLRADASLADSITAAHADRIIRMRGQDTFRAAVQRLSESTLEALEAAELSIADVDLFVYHQANGRITSAVGKRLGLPPERVVDCIARYGNTSAASIPLALVEAEAQGRLHSGARVLMSAFAAGFVWGAGVVEWA